MSQGPGVFEIPSEIYFRKIPNPSDSPVVLECPKTIWDNKEGRSNFTFPTTLPNDPCKLKMDPRKLSSLGWFVLELLYYKSVAKDFCSNFIKVNSV